MLTITDMVALQKSLRYITKNYLTSPLLLDQLMLNIMKV